MLFLPGCPTLGRDITSSFSIQRRTVDQVFYIFFKFIISSFSLYSASMSALLSHLPSIPYPPEQDGYFSPVTSTLDWCEEVC
jgi:hypothetical protein